MNKTQNMIDTYFDRNGGWKFAEMFKDVSQFEKIHVYTGNRYATRCVASHVPMSELDFYRLAYKVLATVMGFKMAVRWRGPRKHRSGRAYAKQSYCLKSDATHFAIYFYVKN